MSEFRVEVIRVGQVTKHPDADSLELTKVHGGYPVIFRSGDFREGDLAVYVPVDSVVPADDQRWAFLGTHSRIKAKRLRGIFSMGILTPSDPAWELGRDVAAEMRIKKYEDPVDGEGRPLGSGEDEIDPGFMPCYTDIDGIRRNPDAFRPGEEVVVTEKIHGANGRWLFYEGKLWCGSRTRIKRMNDLETGASLNTKWVLVARQTGLDHVLESFPGIAVYGEVYGDVGGFPYGIRDRSRPGIALFDAVDVATRRYLDFSEFESLFASISGLIPTKGPGEGSVIMAPVLHWGWYDRDLISSLAEGKSTLDDRHVREGVVVKPVEERFDERVGRVILKMHGEGFLLRGKK